MRISDWSSDVCSSDLTEADFYGSMDGASKFVKGDAVAGLLILFVNIVGGLILGIFSHGLSLSEAGSTYITLAIGDALVAQLPALLLSIAAAAIVKIGRASCREECGSSCRSRWSSYY